MAWVACTPGEADTLAWAACPLPQENLTQLNSVSFFLLLNKNPYTVTWQN